MVLINDRGYDMVRESNSSFPQSVTINLAGEYPDVSIPYYLPKYIPSHNPQEEGSITSNRIYKSSDGSIKIADALMIAQYFVGLTLQFASC